MDLVDIEQRQRRQRDVDDETIEAGRCIVRHAPEATQQHARDEAEDEQDEVVHLTVIPAYAGIQQCNNTGAADKTNSMFFNSAGFPRTRE